MDLKLVRPTLAEVLLISLSLEGRRLRRRDCTRTGADLISLSSLPHDSACGDSQMAEIFDATAAARCVRAVVRARACTAAPSRRRAGNAALKEARTTVGK